MPAILRHLCFPGLTCSQSLLISVHRQRSLLKLTAPNLCSSSSPTISSRFWCTFSACGFLSVAFVDKWTREKYYACNKYIHYFLLIFSKQNRQDRKKVELLQLIQHAIISEKFFPSSRAPFTCSCTEKVAMADFSWSSPTHGLDWIGITGILFNEVFTQHLYCVLQLVRLELA